MVPWCCHLRDDVRIASLLQSRHCRDVRSDTPQASEIKNEYFSQWPRSAAGGKKLCDSRTFVHSRLARSSLFALNIHLGVAFIPYLII